MRIAFKAVSTAASVCTVAAVMAFAPVTVSADGASDLELGKKLSFDRKKGNCLACHMVAGGELPGNIGPPLIAMKARFPNKADLRAQIADARTKNPHSIMIPFEPHGVLNAKEVDLITDYIYTL